MTVAQLIKQLQRMPKNAQVGVSHGDNSVHEIAGWVGRAAYHRKSDYQNDVDKITDHFERDAYDEHPDTWVTLHC